MKFLKEIEFPTNLSAYSKDIFAGLTVAIVALPLAIGFGITSGMSAANGIVTAIVAGFIAALFGGSNWQVSGPTGAMTVVLIPVIAKYGINAIPILGLLSGAMVLVMALFKLGKLIKFVPSSVLEGFTVGIAIIITIQQLPYVFDVEKGSGTRTLVVAYKTLINAIDSKIHWVNIFLVAATLLVKFNIVKIIELLKVRIYVPASFAALTLVTLISLIFNLTIPRIGNIPRAAFEFNFPHIAITANQSNDYGLINLLIPSFTIALLIAIESLLSARVADEIKKAAMPFNPNLELFGQGLASAAASISGGMPATGAIARTGVNIRAGANTRISAMAHSVFLLIIVLFGAPIFAKIPTAAIAGVLIGTSLRIFNRNTFRKVVQEGQASFAIYLVTAIATISIDLIWGIAIGTLFSFILKRVKK